MAPAFVLIARCSTLDEFAALGIAFVSTSEPFDTSTPSGKLLLHMVSAMAEFERSLLIERVRAGVRRSTTWSPPGPSSCPCRP
jgi:DNA invertase Pin-like site-specific DNA recombinase